ncbi:MAG: polysaccharide biosynthesis protein [Tannerellaceae bacterium]|nr:polysaccharide biosynthesis protein [Tannerellaceae bacterium]
MKIKRLIGSLAHVKYLNRWFVLGIDLLLSILATAISLAFVTDLLAPHYVIPISLDLFFIATICSLIGFICCQTYVGVIRHSAFVESGRIALAVFMKEGLMYLFILTFVGQLNSKFLFYNLVIDMCFTFAALMLIRVSLIIGYNYIKENFTSCNGNLLIWGIGSHSTCLPNHLIDKQGNYRMMGYLTYGKKRAGRIGEYKIYRVSDKQEFNELIDTYDIKAILFPDHDSVKEESERLLRMCEAKKVRMLVVPSVDEIKDGKLNFRNLPEVRIEDLLGREEIKINMEEIAQALYNQTVLVTGAAGSIGSEICRQLCSFGLKHLILFDCAETPMHHIRLELEEKFPEVEFTPVVGDVRMLARIESVFTRFLPQVVFHAAAYKHVPLMEENPCESIHTNVLGTRNVADLSLKYGVGKFVMISTDKAVNPTNVMGASKRLAEMYVQSLGSAIRKREHAGRTVFITTHFGNVLGSNGSVIPRFREQLAKGGPLTVTHPDIIRYFMTIPEACRLVLEAAFMGKGNEIFVFDMGTPVKIADLAKRMIQLAGLEPGKDIEIKYTGLRPGEKLFEELLATKENTLPTTNKKIYRAAVRKYIYKEIADAIDELVEVAASVDKMETVRLMKKLIPEFRSQQSEYQILDKEVV